MNKDFITTVENLPSEIINAICRNRKVQKALSVFEPQLYFEFMKIHTFKERVEIFEELYKKYPHKIPIIVEFQNEPQKILKFLMDFDEKVSTLLCKIRANHKTNHSDSMYLMSANNALLISNQSMGEVYKEYLCQREKDACDKIMYIMVFNENTFG
jgi:hypothetical protein